MNIIIFAIGLFIFTTYMYFLIKMINTQHKIQEKEQGSIDSVYYKDIIKGKGKIIHKKEQLKK